MGASAMIGLLANLAPWRKGVRDASTIVKEGLNEKSLNPFNRGVDKAAKNAKDQSKGFIGSFRGAIGAISATVAAIGIYKAFNEGRQIVMESLKAFDDYEDSIVKVKAAVGTLPEEMRRGFDPASLKGLGDNVRQALGIMPKDLNEAFADFVTRGFDTKQARQLSIIAANYAVKTGQPLEDVAKKIADAANGSTEAMKKLGVEIPSTGDKVKDAEAAVLALKAAYGSIGTDLVDPSDQLKANLNELYVVLGERISPILNPLIQGVSDFVNGLMKSEEGKEVLDNIGYGLRNIITFLQQAIPTAEGFFKMWFNAQKFVVSTYGIIIARVSSGIDWIIKKVKGLLNIVVGSTLDGFGMIGEGATEFLTGTAAGKGVAGLLGLDQESLKSSKDYFKTLSKVAQDQMASGYEEMNRDRTEWITKLTDTSENAMANSMTGLQKGWDIYSTGKGSTITEFQDRMVAAGKAARTQATKELQKEQDATKGQGFAGRVAIDEEQQKATEKQRQAEAKNKARMEKDLEATADRRASVRTRGAAGINISVFSRGQDKVTARPVRS